MNVQSDVDEIKRRLFKAVCEDDVDVIKKCLNEVHSNVNLIDHNGCTCVHLAAEYQSLKSLNYLLSLKETQINIKNQRGQTPLLYALESHSSIEIIFSLINHNCDVTIRDNNENTALHLAASNNIEIGRLLIEKGANVDAKDIDGRTALHKAVGKQDVEFVNLLLYYKASVNIADKFKNKPFNLAISNKNDEITTILFDYIEDFGDVKESMKLLISAVSKNMPIAYKIASKIRIDNIENVDLLIFKPIYSCFMHTNDSLKWVRILLNSRIPIKLTDVQSFYDFKGFCAEIEHILTSDVYVIYDNYCGEFIQRLVFNCYINEIECNRKEKDKLKRYFAEEKCVPSLMQIARDYCRKIIFDNQRKNNFKAHRVIMEIDIPKIIKDVLLLKRPIYLPCKYKLDNKEAL